MQNNTYNICLSKSVGEIVEKKSRFIAELIPISKEQEALEFIESVRKKYWDARHHCYAYIVGEQAQIQRCSDDGEPAKTAGRPMLDVLLSKNLINVCVVVTRYFGGVLLGTGGLVRAYQAATIEALSAVNILEKQSGYRISIEANYDMYGKLRYIAENLGIHIEDVEYTELVSIKFVLEASFKDTLLKKISEESSGTLRPIEIEELEFVIDEGRVIIV